MIINAVVWITSPDDDDERRSTERMTAPAADVPKLQQPLPDGSLSIVATGVKEDGVTIMPCPAQQSRWV